MRKILKSFLLTFIFLLSSCSNKDYSRRTMFLSAKYKLSDAVFNETYQPTAAPAYFSQITNSTNCKALFDLENSYVIYNVKIVDGKPIGYGSLNISFSDKSLIDKKCEYFEYICDYDRVYGGVLNQTDETKIDFVGIQSCRMHYYWTRMECHFSEIENGRRIIFEFIVCESYAEPTEFDYEYNI